jgi:hypothetical protein
VEKAAHFMDWQSEFRPLEINNVANGIGAENFQFVWVGAHVHERLLEILKKFVSFIIITHILANLRDGI